MKLVLLFIALLQLNLNIIMNQQHQERIIIKNITNNQLSIRKLKIVQGAEKEYKLCIDLLQKNSKMLTQSNILIVKTCADLGQQYSYTINRLNYQTLREHLNSENYKKCEFEKKLEFLYSIAPKILIAVKFLIAIDNTFILTPEKILIIDDKILVSPFAFDQENMFYDPEYSGISKQNSWNWSVITIFDQILRGKAYFDQDQSYYALENLDNNAELKQFFSKILVRNQFVEIQSLIQQFKVDQKTDLLVCPFHKQRVVKVDLVEKKFFCEKCFKEQFYQMEIEKAECRKLMDQTIQSFKKLNKKFDKIIRLTKGEQSINTKLLKSNIQSVSKDFIKQYTEHIQTIKFSEKPPLEQQVELEHIMQNLESFKEQLVQKYQKKMKRKLIDQIRSQISHE